MEYVYDDGGRSDAGYKGETRDCVCRAISIATGKPYLEVYRELNDLAKLKKPRAGQKAPSARNNMDTKIARKYLESLGWEWVPTRKFGSGCEVHLKKDELPGGTLIVALSKHWSAVLDGVIHDTFDPSRGGTRSVYGYFRKKVEAKSGIDLKQAFGSYMHYRMLVYYSRRLLAHLRKRGEESEESFLTSICPFSPQEEIRTSVRDWKGKAVVLSVGIVNELTSSDGPMYRLFVQHLSESGQKVSNEIILGSTQLEHKNGKEPSLSFRDLAAAYPDVPCTFAVEEDTYPHLINPAALSEKENVRRQITRFLGKEFSDELRDEAESVAREVCPFAIEEKVTGRDANGDWCVNLKVEGIGVPDDLTHGYPRKYYILKVRVLNRRTGLPEGNGFWYGNGDVLDLMERYNGKTPTPYKVRPE